MSSLFTVEDEFELLALHRALYCAKFDEDSSAPELSASPFVAAMAERVVTALQQLHSQGGGPGDWAEWRRAEVHPAEMNLVHRRIAECTVWSSWSLPQRREYVRLLLSPLIATDGTTSELLLHGDGCHPGSGS